MKPIALLLPLLLAAGCVREQPRRVQNDNLGIVAVFPGEARLTKFEEDTPFGRMLWFNTAATRSGRLTDSFHIAVGNLPQGRQGGTTPDEVLATFKTWLDHQLGPVERIELAPDRGPGFRYRRAQPPRWTDGVVVLRQGRLYHAQATVANAADPRVRTFLDSFEVRH